MNTNLASIANQHRTLVQHEIRSTTRMGKKAQAFNRRNKRRKARGAAR